jgi:hypothetical protein
LIEFATGDILRNNPQTNHIMKTILTIVGLVAGLTLTSCVVPYDSITSVRAYSPGYTVNTLPRGYRTERISGSDYYYHNGAYYQRRSNNYVVVNAPNSSRYYDEYTRYGNQTVHNHSDGSSHVINELPRGYTTVDYRGEPYYRYQNNYYRRQGSGYVSVTSPF